jgi:hypothetical protein
VPIGALAVLGAGALACRFYAPADFTPRTLLSWTLVSTIALPIALPFAALRRDRIIADIALYAALTMLFPLAGLTLTYAALAHGLAFQDRAMVALDAVLGFDWPRWSRFLDLHPLVRSVTTVAYQSSLWQPFVTIPVLAIWAPRRNAELFTATALAALLTIGIAALVPTIGPAGPQSLQAQIILGLRAGRPPIEPFGGVVSFPSFHTAVALLYVTAHRGIRWSFPPFLALNAVLLFGVPDPGNHYLVDMLAGVPVAALALWASRRLVGTGRPADQ